MRHANQRWEAAPGIHGACQRIRCRPFHSMGWLGTGTLLLVVLVSPGEAITAELNLRDFNGSGFDWTWGGFEQTTGPNSVRLNDPADGWGGAGVSVGGLDLSSFADGRLVIDLIPQAGSGVDSFDLELIEQSASGQTTKSGKWTFHVSSLTPGVPTTLVSQSTLSNPTSGIGDFQNLNLSQIESWQVLGQFGSSQPLDIRFDNIAVSDSVDPPPAYPGAEPDAPWRSQATARIDALRKADFTVTVVDAAGNAVPNATVSIVQQQHDFGFGSAVVASRLRDNNPQHNQYKSKVAELFNIATLENNLKWPPWEGEWGPNFSQQGAVSALDWLAQNGIEGRGHVMVWPGYNNLPTDIKALLDGGPLNAAEQQTVRDRIAAHITNIGSATAGKVVAWDVINETRTNHDLMDQLSEGNQAMVTWFELAAAAAPGAALYLNDFGILSSAGGTSTSNQDQYFATIEYLKNQGAPIDGIGFQGHFTASDLTGPEQLWTILDRFGQFGLNMQITEFDFTTSDEQLQADYTRDFLTAMFAHEGVSDFIFWGFWEAAHWRSEAAMYRSDWSIKPNGQAFLDLVFGDWWTNEQSQSDGSGEVNSRVFKGRHQVTAALGGVDVTLSTSVSNDGAEVTLVLPTLLGDYNGDGTVNLADYTVWRDTLGSESVLAADGNGSGVVDAEDFLIWKQSFGTSLPPSLPQTATIPEPASYTTLLLWILAVAARVCAAVKEGRRRTKCLTGDSASP